MIRKRLFVLTITSILLSAPVYAQGLSDSIDDAHPKTHLRIGAYGEYAWISHESKAHVFCCDDGCGVFGNGKGSGIALGMLLEVPIIPMLDGVGQFGFAQRGGDFGDSRTGSQPIQDPKTKQYVPLQLKHSYTTILPELIAELGVKFTPLNEYPFYLRATFFGAFPMADATTYKQTEEILSPQGVTYPSTGTVMRQIGAGAILGLKESYGISGALGYPFPLSEELTAAPEVSYYYPLTQTKDDFQWKISALQAGVAFRWSFLEKKEPPPPPPPPPPPTPVVKKQEPPQPYIGLASQETVKVVETNVTETFPILPYIFFDSASANILPRYHQIAANVRSSFREQDIPHNSLGAYYHLLNIIGSRLSQKPDAVITLTGTTDGKEASGAATKTLSKSRAEEIKKYLTDTWGVDEARIKTATRPTPTYPSSTHELAGIEENRRVEITSPDESMLAPIVHEQFKEFAIQPDNMPFSASVRLESPATEWKLRVMSKENLVYETAGSGEPPATLVWKLDNAAAEKIAKVAQGETKFKCILEVKDKTGTTGSSTVDMPVEKSIYPFELSRLSLVVFDFDKADITPVNQNMVSSFVSKTIRDGSTVAITGTTDAMGELDHNKELSTNRAFAVHKLIKEENPVAEITKVQGIGPNEAPEMNATPEGRYYCRTVTVQVQTPLGKK